jgi:CDP-6-deoxy-D-xylo-4-hexulose-3-dehydrase
VLLLPESTPDAEPSWFGFPVGVREDAPFTRDALIRELDAKRIGTRLLFGGNLIRQPAYQHSKYRVVSDLNRTDYIMRSVFWLGIFPGITETMLDFVGDTIGVFVAAQKTRGFIPVLQN